MYRSRKEERSHHREDADQRKEMPESVSLTYFSLQGRGEIIRYILHVAKVPFDDRRLSQEEWGEGTLKAEAPFGHLPLLNWDGLQISQTNTIVRFISKKLDLAGTTEEEELQADMILEHVRDALQEIIKLRFCPDMEAKQNMAQSFLQKFLPSWLERNERFLAAHGEEWYATSGLTYADLAVAIFLGFIVWEGERGFMGTEDTEERFNILDNYPLTKSNFERVMENPEIQAYIETRPDSDPAGL